MSAPCSNRLWEKGSVDSVADLGGTPSEEQKRVAIKQWNNGKYIQSKGRGMISDLLRGARQDKIAKNGNSEDRCLPLHTPLIHARKHARKHAHRLSHTDTRLWRVNVRPRKGANDAAMATTTSTTMVLLLCRKLSTSRLGDGHIEVVISGLIPVVTCACVACEGGVEAEYRLSSWL